MHHHHEHGENCGCGDHHHHEHGENCGCGLAPVPMPDGMSAMQIEFLMALRQRGCLPVASFALASTTDKTRRGVALAPVYLSAPDDSMEKAKNIGSVLSSLEDMDLLTLDYDMPLRNYAYAEYKTAALYAYFVKTVAEASTLPNATFDTPVLELGSMALTRRGENFVDTLVR